MVKSFIGKLNEEMNRKDVSQLQNEIIQLKKQLEESSNSSLGLEKLSSIRSVSNIRNTGTFYDFEEIKELADDIEKNGQLQPILITKDKHLLFGSRRFLAVSLLFKEGRGKNEILVNTYPKDFKEIGKVELKDIQYAENEQRRQIDNFQLSRLYNDLADMGLSQKDLQEKFKKSKSFVSFIIKIDNIDPDLVKWLKEFQVFGWSQKKFSTLNYDASIDEKVKKEFEKLRGIVGMNILYKIGKQESIEDQKKVFLKSFGKRLDMEEINSKYFDGVREEKKEVTAVTDQAIKAVKGTEKKIYKLIEGLPDIDPEKAKKITKHFFEIEKVLKGL
jgi:ParB/RepB/Spo0J family partition protein